jgi:hypothetical protein
MAAQILEKIVMSPLMIMDVEMKNVMKMKNEKGIATIESALLLSIFVVFMTYCVGTFGVIHTGILNSISARAYTFETFRNRTNLTYFRDTDGVDFVQNKNYAVRVHGIITEKATEEERTWLVTERTLAQGRDVASVRSGEGKMNELNYKRKETGKANPVWIKTVYGICLNYKCGDI